MPLTEQGHYVGTIVDEFGKRRVDGLLETGRRIIVIIIEEEVIVPLRLLLGVGR